jgi:hypothetical protein
MDELVEDSLRSLLPRRGTLQAVLYLIIVFFTEALNSELRVDKWDKLYCKRLISGLYFPCVNSEQKLEQKLCVPLRLPSASLCV